MKIKLINVILENINRQNKISDYQRSHDPFSGRGCSGLRKPVYDPVSGTTLFLKKSQINDINFNPSIPNLNRNHHDFEFWLVSSYMKFDSTFHGFSMPLYHIISLMESFRNDDMATKLIILHASKIGISSICEAYIYWRQFVKNEGNDAIFYHPFASAKIESKYRFYRRSIIHPEVFDFKKRNVFHASSNSVSVYKEGNINRYLTLNNPFATRGCNAKFVLYSDVNSAVSCNVNDFYRLQNGDKLSLAFFSNLSSHSDSLVILESNACSSHLGGFFNNSYRSCNGIPLHLEAKSFSHHKWIRKHDNDHFNRIRNSYIPPYSDCFNSVFIPWHWDFSKSLKLKQGIRRFWNSLTRYEYFLWNNVGCTLEQINWYRNTISGIKNPAMVVKLFPSTENEALTHSLEYTEDMVIPSLTYNYLDIPSRDIDVNLSFSGTGCHVSDLLNIIDFESLNTTNYTSCSSLSHNCDLVFYDALAPPGF